MATATPNDLSNWWMPFTDNRFFKSQPRQLVAAKDMHYTAADGRQVLDGTAGLWCVNAGHGREAIVRAIQAQADELDFAPSFQLGHPLAFQLAARVAALMPQGLDRIFFTNSGSESVDTALKIALAYWRAKGEGQRTRLIGRERGYHGVGFGGISVGGILPNRRAFERRLVSASLEARAKGERLSIAFCDVDRFKMINDRHGHEAGDRVLCAVAATLNETAGDACFVARQGGEEFVLLFYGMDKEEARAKLDMIRRAQAARQLMNRDTGRPFGKVTFSGGVAEVTEDSDTRSALGRADTALYRAKEAGRNRVMVG
jgi:diguanylate cyclase (GGDEF)-like protein